MDTQVDITPVPLPNPVVTSVRMSMINYVLHATEFDVMAYSQDSSGRAVGSQMVHIPPEICSQWGTDDDFIVDYVLQQLGFSRQLVPQ